MQEKNGHLFHSTLFVGARFDRRKEKALELAGAVLKTSPEKVKGLDFFEIGMDPAQTTISIETIRELQKQLANKPYQAPKKVALIFESQKMTAAAQNCLLKTLEEPPAHSLLILTANDNESVLPTVRSRCRLVDLGPTVYEGKSGEGGNILELLQKNRGQRLLWVEENKKMLGDRQEVLALLDDWLITLREMIVNLKGVRKHSLQVGFPYHQAIRQILATKKTLATVNVNLRLALEVLLLHLPQTKPEGSAKAVPSG